MIHNPLNWPAYYKLTLDEKISYLAGLLYLKQQLDIETSVAVMVVSEQVGRYETVGVDLEQDIHMFLRELTLSGRSQSSLSRYRLTMQQFADFCAENRISYLHISAKQVKAFRNILVQSNLGASAINSRLSHLKIFYEFLAEEDRVMGNPVNRRRLSIKRAQKLPGYLSPEEKKLVLAWLEHASYNVCLAFRTMFASGLRLSECTNLAPEDLLVRNHAYLLRVRRGKGLKQLPK